MHGSTLPISLRPSRHLPLYTAYGPMGLWPMDLPHAWQHPPHWLQPQQTPPPQHGLQTYGLTLFVAASSPSASAPADASNSSSSAARAAAASAASSSSAYARMLHVMVCII
eukprot:1156090-Pelagomonas_calceolata.AAC.4